LGSEGGRASESPGTSALATFLTFAAPDEGCWGGVPAHDGVLEPGDQLVLTRRMLAGQCATADNALQRLRHIQPRTADGRVQGHDAVLEQPADDRATQVSGEIIPHEDQAQGREWFSGLVAKPGHPPSGRRSLVLGEFDLGQGSQHLLQFGLEPRVQHDIGGAGDAPGTQGTGGRAKERQQFGGAAAEILVGLARWLGLGLPGRAALRDGLVGSRLILAEQRNPCSLRLAVRSLNQPLFCSVCGSTTVTGPLVRCRTAVPVGHHVLVR